MSKDRKESYPDYPIFKGLQRPLEFMGIQGRYIYWAAGTIGAAIAGFIIGYCIVGFILGLIFLATALVIGIGLILGKAYTRNRTKRASTYMPIQRRFKKETMANTWLI